MKTNDFIISVPKYLITILRKWRILLLTGIIFAFLCGGYKGMKKYQENNSSDYIASQQEDYADAKEEYKTGKGINEVTIEDANKKIVSLNEYIKESIMMKIDSYNANVAIAGISYQAEGQASIDNQDVVDSVLGDGLQLLQSDALYSYVAEKTGLSIQEKYLQEIIKPTVNYDANRLDISVYYTDAEDAGTILDSVVEYLQNTQMTSCNGVDVHMITSDYSNTVVINKDFHDAQNRVYLQLETLKTMREKYNVEASEPAAPDFSNSNVVKTAVKWGICGFLGGALLSFFVLTMIYLLNGKLKNENDIDGSLEIPIVGVVRKMKKHKILKFVDCWIDTLEQRLYGSDDLAMQIFYLNILLDKCEDANSKIMVTSTLDMDVIQEGFAAFLNHTGKDTMKWSTGERLISNLTTAQETAQCDAVVLIEKIGISRYKDLIKQKKMLEAMDKKIIGCVCIE